MALTSSVAISGDDRGLDGAEDAERAAPCAQQRQRVGFIAVGGHQLRQQPHVAGIRRQFGRRPAAGRTMAEAVRAGTRARGARADRCHADRARTGGRVRHARSRAESQSRRPPTPLWASTLEAWRAPADPGAAARAACADRRATAWRSPRRPAPAPWRSRRRGRCAGTDCACARRSARCGRVGDGQDVAGAAHVDDRYLIGHRGQLAADVADVSVDAAIVGGEAAARAPGA